MAAFIVFVPTQNIPQSIKRKETPIADENDLIFCEVQKFSFWLRLFIVLSMALAVIFDCFALHKMLSQQETSKVLPITSLIIFGILLPIAIAILFLMLKMQTEVRNEALYVRFYRFTSIIKSLLPTI